MSKITITPDALKDSAQKFRPELLMLAIIGLEDSTQHMSIRMGIEGKETVGQLSGKAQFGPYSVDRKSAGKVEIKGRTLETFFGSVIQDFEPNSVLGSIYGDPKRTPTDLQGAGINKAVLELIMSGLSEGLNDALFSAVRNPAGDSSEDLFNGFDTITSAEITAGNITEEKGNLFTMPGVIDDANAVDMVKKFYRASDQRLRRATTKIFMDYSTFDAYQEAYKATSGAAPYNTSFEQVFLEGSQRKCELIPLASKSGSKFLHLTTPDNMLVGCSQMSDKETIAVDKFSSFTLTASAAMFFGVEFESVDKSRMAVAKLKTV